MRNYDLNDYMNSVYAILEEPVDDDNNNGVVYLDEDYDDEFVDDNWEDDITYIGDEDEDDLGYIEDLGDGYIPLPTGDDVEYEVVVIDENYMLDEYERDIDSSVTYVDDAYDSSTEILVVDSQGVNDIPELQIDSADSVIKLPETKTMADELNAGLGPIDDKISKAIAREYIADSEANVELLPGDDVEEDASWVDSEDLFGNNIELILSDDPNEEIEDTDYINGSFEDWIQANC